MFVTSVPVRYQLHVYKTYRNLRFTNFVLINQRPRVTRIPNTSPKSDVRTKYPVSIPVNHNAKKCTIICNLQTNHTFVDKLLEA